MSQNQGSVPPPPERLVSAAKNVLVATKSLIDGASRDSQPSTPKSRNNTEKNRKKKAKKLEKKKQLKANAQVDNKVSGKEAHNGEEKEKEKRKKEEATLLVERERLSQQQLQSVGVALGGVNMEALLKSSQCVVALTKGDHILAFGRVASDGATHSFVLVNVFDSGDGGDEWAAQQVSDHLLADQSWSRVGTVIVFEPLKGVACIQARTSFRVGASK